MLGVSVTKGVEWGGRWALLYALHLWKTRDCCGRLWVGLNYHQRVFPSVFAAASFQAHVSRAHCSLYTWFSCCAGVQRVAHRCVRWAGPPCGRWFTSFSMRCVGWKTVSVVCKLAVNAFSSL